MTEDIVIAGTAIPEAGAYRCTTCDLRLQGDGTELMQPGPCCGQGQWARATREAASPRPEGASTDGIPS